MNQPLKILVTYETASGKRPFEEWLSGLKSDHTKLRIQKRVSRLEVGDAGDSKNIGEGLKELRLHFGSGYRVYYAEMGMLIIMLLCGGNKSSQRRDIVKAKTYLNDLKNRMPHEEQ
jgi:putative addiction module killer protein